MPAAIETGEAHMKLRAVLAAILAVAAWLSAPVAYAMGGGGSGGGGNMDSMRGSGDSPDNALRAQYRKAVKAVEARDFATAEALLGDYVTKKKKSADAWNYLAFSQRNLGKNEIAMENYNKALAIDPKHKGALEYQGELFLKMGKKAEAEKNLVLISEICPGGCDAKTELQAALERFKDGKFTWTGATGSN